MGTPLGNISEGATQSSPSTLFTSASSGIVNEERSVPAAVATQLSAALPLNVVDLTDRDDAVSVRSSATSSNEATRIAYERDKRLELESIELAERKIQLKREIVASELEGIQARASASSHGSHRSRRPPNSTTAAQAAASIRNAQLAVPYFTGSGSEHSRNSPPHSSPPGFGSGKPGQTSNFTLNQSYQQVNVQQNEQHVSLATEINLRQTEFNNEQLRLNWQQEALNRDCQAT